MDEVNQGTIGHHTERDRQYQDLYRELRVIAARQLKGANRHITLQPTVLVHEAYLKISKSNSSLRDRAHLLCAASTIMRQIVVDHARARSRQKRGGGQVVAEFDVNLGSSSSGLDVLMVHEILNRLAELDSRQAKLVELKCFGGLTTAEIAETLEVCTKTVLRDWEMARAWLQRELRNWHPSDG